MIFLMYVATIQHTTADKTLNYNQKAQSAVYISDTPVTLKQSQGHKTRNENADQEQGYNYATFESSHFNSIPEKGHTFLFQMNNYVKYLP